MQVLLTGAAGAIGQPLLRELAAHPRVERIYALQHREPIAPRPKVCSIEGDVTDPRLAITPDAHATLTSEITAIVHAAADTRFGADAETLRTTNVAGTLNVLSFAERCQHLDRVVALSTTHVCGRRTGVILETELEHDCGFVNPYEASKYAMELELRGRMDDLPLAVARLSTTIGDAQDGSIARSGAIHHAVRLMYAGLAPMIPGHEDSPVDFVAGDHAARAVALLATDAFDAGATWHIGAGSDTIRAGELLDLTLDCFLEYRPAWRRRAIERPAVVDLATFELFCRSADRAGTPTLRAAASVMAAFAPQLAFPKQFDDSRCRAALHAHGITAPAVRDVWERVVRRIVASE